MPPPLPQYPPGVPGPDQEPMVSARKEEAGELQWPKTGEETAGANWHGEPDARAAGGRGKQPHWFTQRQWTL